MCRNDYDKNSLCINRGDFVSGIYTGMSGMIANEVNLSITGNNIANSKTSGYKSDVGVNRVYEESFVSRIGNGVSGIGNYDNQVVVDEKHKNFKQGFAEPTNRGLDFYINDLNQEVVSFMKVQSEQETFLTRDGRMYVDGEGNLTNSLGYFVLDENDNKINLSGSNLDDIILRSDGSLINSQSNDIIANISVQGVHTDNLQTLVKVGDNVYSEGFQTEIEQGDFEIHSGYLETSNVDINKEMIDLMTSQKGYAMNSKSFQSYDKISDLESNRLAR